jgi:hypothetical protein
MTYPTLFFFRKGKQHAYTGKKENAGNIVEWMEIHSVPILTTISNMYELEQFKEA